MQIYRLKCNGGVTKELPVWSAALRGGVCVGWSLPRGMGTVMYKESISVTPKMNSLF